MMNHTMTADKISYAQQTVSLSTSYTHIEELCLFSNINMLTQAQRLERDESDACVLSVMNKYIRVYS